MVFVQFIFIIIIFTLKCVQTMEQIPETTTIIPSPVVGSKILPEECTPDAANLLDVDLVNIPPAFVTCTEEVASLKNKTHPDAKKNTSELITSYGYPLEVYSVTTEDGYILTVHRIPNIGKTPVYLQHGQAGCSDNWLLIGNGSLAFLLANAGYDVWLGNFRGTTYSLGHKTLKWDNPTDFSYWNFSWHEMGEYDFPAIVSFIKTTTGKRLCYIGHSMGTTAFLVGASLGSDPFNDKIFAAILLAVAGFEARSSSVFRLLASLATKVDPQYLETISRGRIENPDDFLKLVNTSVVDFCTPTATRCAICANLLFAIFGFDAPQMNYTNLPNIVGRVNTMSVKSLYHYAQSMDKCTFRQFDYGPEKNKKIYGSDIPPDYLPTIYKIPVHSFYGNFDNICRPKDVSRTLDLLPQNILKENVQVDWTYFNHLDFLIAKDLFDLLYKDILRIIKSYTS